MDQRSVTASTSTPQGSPASPTPIGTTLIQEPVNVSEKPRKKIIFFLILLIVGGGLIYKNPFSESLKSDVLETVETSATLEISSPDDESTPFEAVSPEAPVEEVVPPEAPVEEAGTEASTTETSEEGSPEAPVQEEDSTGTSAGTLPEAISLETPGEQETSTATPSEAAAPTALEPAPVPPERTVSSRSLLQNPVSASPSGTSLGFYEIIPGDKPEEMRVAVSAASVTEGSTIKLLKWNEQGNTWTPVSVPLEGNAETGFFFRLQVSKP